MTEYFVRYTCNPGDDIRRGYSFHGYMLFRSKRSALENIADLSGAAYEVEDFNFQRWARENSWRVAKDPATKKWGQRRSGLCGFGPFSEIEEAREFARENCYGLYDHGAIFTGVEVFDQDTDGEDEGVTFKPLSIVEEF
ncbi:MAG: hypothetical protein AMXMBFR16_13040 [Candidatus Uhrbacteria bacterium]